MPDKKTLGKLPRDAIRLLELPCLPAEIVDVFKALIDLTGTISDACDLLGIVGVVPAYVMPPVNSGKRIVGPALTVRNIHHATQIHKAAQDNASGQGETEAHNLATPGDVLVIEGVMGCSNMGGQSATISRREGCIGAIVDGTLRDPDQYRVRFERQALSHRAHDRDRAPKTQHLLHRHAGLLPIEHRNRPVGQVANDRVRGLRGHGGEVAVGNDQKSGRSHGQDGTG